MKKLLAAIAMLFALVTTAQADNVLVIDAQYDQVTNNVKSRLEAAGHTVTVTTDLSRIPTATSTFQQVWDLRYAAVLSTSEQTAYQAYITNGGFAYFVTENPGCCQARNNSVAALVTALGGGTTTIGTNNAFAANIESNVNTKYMTSGITVNYAAVAVITNSQGIPLISDSSGNVSGMSWIGRANDLGQGVTGTIVTVADTNWLDAARFNATGTTAQQQNVTALDDIIKGIVAGTVGGTISANGNGAAASNGAAQTPTVVSTAAGAPTVTSTASNGAASFSNASTRGVTSNVSGSVLGATVVTSSNRDVAAKNAKTINVTRTTTVVGTTPRTTTITSTTPVTTVTTTITPRTTTTTTVPVTVTTYSDGSTTSTNGTPVVTTSTVNVTTTSSATVNEVVVTTVRDSIVQTASSDQTGSVSAAGLKDALAVGRFNPFLVDAISTKDGAWITPSMGYAKAGGTIRSSMIGFGAQQTVENNTAGVAGAFGKTNIHNYLNTTGSSNSYGATAYFLNKEEIVWTKVAVGFGVSEYSTAVSLPIFALSNSSKVNAKNYYADLTFYSGQEVYGLRPLAGVTVVNSTISSKLETGSVLLSTLPADDRIFEARPYAGVRYDLDGAFGVELRAIRSKDFNTVGQLRGTAKYEVIKDVFFELQAGFDKSSNYNAAVGMAGVKVNF